MNYFYFPKFPHEKLINKISYAIKYFLTTNQLNSQILYIDY